MARQLNEPSIHAIVTESYVPQCICARTDYDAPETVEVRMARRVRAHLRIRTFCAQLKMCAQTLGLLLDRTSVQEAHTHTHIVHESVRASE
jgi:hypothetical protein